MVKFNKRAAILHHISREGPEGVCFGDKGECSICTTNTVQHIGPASSEHFFRVCTNKVVKIGKADFSSTFHLLHSDLFCKDF
jgi:hypothetical protein